LCMLAPLLVLAEPKFNRRTGRHAPENQTRNHHAGQFDLNAEILGMSQRVLVMRNGRIVAEFPRDRATEERIMAAATGQTALIA
jgi:hypothetical protein